MNKTALWSLHLPIFEFFNLSLIKFSWHSSSMWDRLGWNDGSGNVSVKGYLPLIRKDSVIHMHGLAVYVKEGLVFAWDLYLKNSVDSHVFNWLCFIQCSVFLLFLWSIIFFIFVNNFWSKFIQHRRSFLDQPIC